MDWQARRAILAREKRWVDILRYFSLIFHLPTGVNGTNSERPPPIQPSLRSRSVQYFGLLTPVASAMSAGDIAALPPNARKHLASVCTTRTVANVILRSALALASH